MWQCWYSHLYTAWVDSVEDGLAEIQEYYANTGALKKAAENSKQSDETGQKKKVALSVIEAFGGASGNNTNVQVKDVEDGKSIHT